MHQNEHARKRFVSGKGLWMGLILSGIFGFCIPALPQQYEQIVIATGSPYELGLIDELSKAFQEKHGGAVRCVKTPTGPGLDLARHGLVHITLGHEKEATARLAEEGHVEKRADLMHNYTVIVGPGKDPAGIAGLSDLHEAHRRIFQTGSPYLSRGDGGGMHILELKIWKALNLTPPAEAWYEVSRQFMLSSLVGANERKQYHMLDSSTWTMHAAKAPGLKLLVQGPPNEYEMCLISADNHPNLRYNRAMAETMYEFLIGDEGQKIIAEFGVVQYGGPIYFPSRKPYSEP